MAYTKDELYSKEYVDQINTSGMSIVGSSPGRVQEEYNRAIASGVNPNKLKMDIKPIVQPSGEITRPIGDYPPTQLTGGGLWTGTGIMPITGASITPAADLSKQISVPSYNPAYDISKLGSGIMTYEEATSGDAGIKTYKERQAIQPTGLAPEERKAQTLSERIQALNEQLTGQSAFRAGQEISQDVLGKQRTVLDLTSQLRILQNEALAIPLQQAGVNVTSAMLGAKQRELLTQNSIKALGISAFLEAARGNLALAYDLVDRAVAAKFDPMKEEIAAKTANYNLIIKSPEFSLSEQKRAQQLKDIETAKSAVIKKQEIETENIYKIGLEAAKNGASAMILRDINNAKSPQEALEIVAKSGIYKKEIKPTGILTPTSEIITTPSGEQLEYGTPEYMIERLKQTAGSKTKLVASEREQLGKFANVVALTDNLMQSLDKATNDPILGYLKSLNPYDFDARAVNAQVTALVPSVARALYGEVGVLTDTDIERYLKTLPNIRSTTDQNKFIAAMTLSNAKRAYEQTLLNSANSGVNVSAFVDSYKNLTDRLTKIEKDIGVGKIIGVPENKVAIFDEVISKPQGYWSNLWNAIIGK